MSKVYTDMSDYERAAEEEFRNKVEELSYYQGEVERTTIDGEWTEEELKGDIWDEASKLVDDWIEKNKHRALKDDKLTHVEFIVNDICSRYDIIEVYNRAYDLHRNDKNRMFGIHYYDELVRAEVKKVLDNNLVNNQ